MLVRMDKQDDRYFAALDKRTEYFSVGIVTKLTVRQLAHNAHGFALRNDKKFWEALQNAQNGKHQSDDDCYWPPTLKIPNSDL